MIGAGNYGDAARARDFVARLSVEVIGARAASRVGLGRGAGDRPAPSLAGAALRLLAAEEGSERVAVRGLSRELPRALSQYSKRDGRRMAALVYCAALERSGAIRGADLSGDRTPAPAGSVPDGGASARLEDLALLRAADLACNFPSSSGREVLSIERRRKGDKRSAITARDLWRGVVVEGRSMAEILRRHGWSVRPDQVATLSRDFEAMAWRVADKFGLRSRVIERPAKGAKGRGKLS